MRLPPPLPPADYPALLRHATTWAPEELGLPRAVLQEARRLAGEIAAPLGRREAIARYLVARAACEIGWLTYVVRIPLFLAPGFLVSDPQREALYWALDPGVAVEFEDRAVPRLAEVLRQHTEPSTVDVAPTTPAGER